MPATAQKPTERLPHQSEISQEKIGNLIEADEKSDLL